MCHDNIQISCLDCSVDSGKIAAAYANQVIIFEPTPLSFSSPENGQKPNKDGLDYWWVETARFKTECRVSTLSWNNEGNRLLTAGDYIQLWQYKQQDSSSLDGISILPSANDTKDSHGVWSCPWKVRPANPVHFLAYSPDGTLFATAGVNDRLVRIWYENQQMLLPGQGQENLRFGLSLNEISFGYIYVAHPRSVTAISWRKTSKYMPRGAVANVLATSCVDNICRLWSETILPDDGIVSMQQLDPAAAQDIKFRTHRQKTRFIQRFRHLRQSFAARKLGKMSNAGSRPDPIASLPSTYSIHEFHNYSFQGSGISPGLHFHLAATINALTDIPLVPAMNRGDSNANSQHFILHWMNNKEMEFSCQAEKMMEQLFKISIKRESESNFELELVGSEQALHMAAPRSAAELRKPRSHVDVGLSHTGSSSSLTANSETSQAGSNPPNAGMLNSSLSETLDRKIDGIIKEWHQNSDLLFAVHPIDGSLLVWVADFLDEYQPGAFRQTQISFSARIPNAIPLGDAMTIGSNVDIYNSGNMNFRDLIKASQEEMAEKEKPRDAKLEENICEEVEEDEDHDGEVEEKEKEPEATKPAERKKTHKYKPAPMVSLISKHTNGTLNLWNVMFADKSKFASLLNISHRARASGHRFRVNDITCHPVLPLMLTTSHHNVVNDTDDIDLGMGSEISCSELILWRVDAVGPLSKSGGITELARINSKEISAFTDVTWVPTLLPSTILGSYSNSPSACFVASDGNSLRVYQAVIDARSLLAEINSTAATDVMESSIISVSSNDSSLREAATRATNLREKLKIVSSQSTARPGAIIELEPIEDATQDWQNTMMLHAFQEQLIVAQGTIPNRRCPGKEDKSTGLNFGLITSKMSAMVDLQNHDGFCEPFYALVVEKTPRGGAEMHMWRLELCSDGESAQDGDANSSGTVTPDGEFDDRPHHHHGHFSQVHVSTEKVCTQSLPLPEGVEVIDAVPAAGHLSSSSIFPACLAPYLLVTACSDDTVRFWRTKLVTSEAQTEAKFEWEEWQMESFEGVSAIQVPGRPLSVSAAYTGRVAIAYQTGKAFQRTQGDPSQRYINLCLAIYECESSGGSEWILEDTVYLKNIELMPSIPQMDLSVYKQNNTTANSHIFNHGTVPSLSTLEGVKRYIEKMGNAPTLMTPKRVIMLDWVSNEDGSHILTVTVGNKVLFMTAVSNDISQANVKAVNDSRNNPVTRPLLRKSSSMGFQQMVDDVR